MSTAIKPFGLRTVYSKNHSNIQGIMKKRIPFHLILSVMSVSAFAQDESDALRLSFLQPQGTARSLGIGSALGSVGGDFTSLSVNPAGIGVYRRSEFMFTPSLVFNNTKSRYATGVPEEDNGTAFNFSNIGYVLTHS